MNEKTFNKIERMICMCGGRDILYNREDDLQQILIRNERNLNVDINTLKEMLDGTFDKGILTQDTYTPPKKKITSKVDRLYKLLKVVDEHNISTRKELEKLTGFSTQQLRDTLNFSTTIKKGNFYYGNIISDKRLTDDDVDYDIIDTNTGEILDSDKLLALIINIKKKNKIPDKYKQVDLNTGVYSPIDKRLLNFIRRNI